MLEIGARFHFSAVDSRTKCSPVNRKLQNQFVLSKFFFLLILVTSSLCGHLCPLGALQICIHTQPAKGTWCHLQKIQIQASETELRLAKGCLLKVMKAVGARYNQRH